MMVIMYGDYNIDFAGESWDENVEYQIVIISKFDGDTELFRKTYYFADSERDVIEVAIKNHIETLVKMPNNARFKAKRMTVIVPM